MSTIPDYPYLRIPFYSLSTILIVTGAYVLFLTPTWAFFRYLMLFVGFLAVLENVLMISKIYKRNANVQNLVKKLKETMKHAEKTE